MNYSGETTPGYHPTTIMYNFTSDLTGVPPTDGFNFSSTSLLVLTVIISLVAVVGLLGNAMVMFIVFHYRDMHTVINYSFANLALTDLTLLLVDAVPTVFDSLGTNFSASLGCNVPIYLQYVAAEVTSFTLAFLSYDRYRLIVHPIKSFHRRTPKTLLQIFICIWLASFILQIPGLLVPGLTPNGSCSEFNAPWGRELFFCYAMASLFCVPTTIIVLCYARMGRKMLAAGPPSSMKAHRRRRSVNTILMVIIIYALCWVPCHTVHMWMAFDPEVSPNSALYIELHTAANVLIFFNSTVNPFVYTLVGASFRNHAKTIMMSIATCNPNYSLSNNLKKGESRLSLYKPNDPVLKPPKKMNSSFSTSGTAEPASPGVEAPSASIADTVHISSTWL